MSPTPHCHRHGQVARDRFRQQHHRLRRGTQSGRPLQQLLGLMHRGAEIIEMLVDGRHQGRAPVHRDTQPRLGQFSQGHRGPGRQQRLGKDRADSLPHQLHQRPSLPADNLVHRAEVRMQLPKRRGVSQLLEQPVGVVQLCRQQCHLLHMHQLLGGQALPRKQLAEQRMRRRPRGGAGVGPARLPLHPGHDLVGGLVRQLEGLAAWPQFARQASLRSPVERQAPPGRRGPWHHPEVQPPGQLRPPQAIGPLPQLQVQQEPLTRRDPHLRHHVR